MKQRVEEMEREATKLRELQAAAEQAEQSAGGGENVPMDTEEDKAAADSRSIYVGNVRVDTIICTYAYTDDQRVG